MSTRARTAPPPFRWVSPTPEEVQAYRNSHAGRFPHRTVRRMSCLNCGKRIWGSGIAIGSHRKVCGELPVPDRTTERAELTAKLVEARIAVVEARIAAEDANDTARRAEAWLANLERLLKELD